MMQLASGTEDHSALILFEVPSLDNTFGALLIGTICTSVLWGLSAHQTYRYFIAYTSDPVFLKAMESGQKKSQTITLTSTQVSVLCVLDIIHEMLAMHFCYFYLVSNYSNPIRLLSGVWSLRFIVTVTGLIAMIAHLFFTRRVFILSGRPKLFPFFAIILVVAEIAFCITATVVTFVDVTFARFRQHSFWIIYTALGLRVVTDLVLTGSLILFLQRSRTGFTTTERMIDVLTLYAINTGLVTSLFSLAAAVAAAVLPDTLIYIAIYIVSSKMYSTSVLATLNSRKRISQLSVGRRTNPSSWLDMHSLDVRVPVPSRGHQLAETRDAIELQIKSTGSVIGSSSTIGI